MNAEKHQLFLSLLSAGGVNGGQEPVPRMSSVLLSKHAERQQIPV